MLRLKLVLSTLLLAMLIGCSNGGGESLDTVKVSGLVKLNGAPLAGATVTFAPADKTGRTAVGLSDAEGKFTLTTVTAGDGALPGSYHVGIRKPIAPAPQIAVDPRTEGRKLDTNAEKQIMQAAKGAGKKKDGQLADAVPPKYHDPAGSGLTAEVKKGDKNEFTFTLQ